MTTTSDAINRVREVLAHAADSFGVPLSGDLNPVVEAQIQCVRLTQGTSAPGSLTEYWRLAGADGDPTLGQVADRRRNYGMWRQFARCDGFSVGSSVRSRMLAIETALEAGWDWRKFRFAEPLVTFNYLPGGEVFWVPFDEEAKTSDQDPPVLMLRESAGAEPELISDRFSDYLRGMIDREIKMRAQPERMPDDSFDLSRLTDWEVTAVQNEISADDDSQ